MLCIGMLFQTQGFVKRVFSRNIKLETEIVIIQLCVQLS